MAIRSSRIELRAAPASERRLRFAASLAKQTLSAFLLDAATERAERVISESRETLVPPAFFDKLWRSLDKPPAPNKSLRRAAGKARRVRQLR